MRPAGWLTALAVVTACHHATAPAAVAPAAAAARTDSALAIQIRARIAAVPGAVVGVAYHHLGHADAVLVDADRSMHAASTMKVPVMIEVFRRADAGTLSLDSLVVVRNLFASIVDGSPYTLDPGDDSDSSMYARVGTGVSIRELVMRMIQRSSNLATNTIIALVGPARVDSTARALGAMHTRVLRGVEDGLAFKAGRNNTLTASDLATLLAAIADDRAASPASCAAMRAILTAQEFNTEIPAGLPPGTVVAHKTGWITGALHDAAIVYPAGPAGGPGSAYILVVLTSDIPDERVARALIVDISRMVYAFDTRATAAERR